jgi:hypothetical protein
VPGQVPRVPCTGAVTAHDCAFAAIGMMSRAAASAQNTILMGKFVQRYSVIEVPFPVGLYCCDRNSLHEMRFVVQNQILRIRLKVSGCERIAWSGCINVGCDEIAR